MSQAVSIQVEDGFDLNDLRNVDLYLWGSKFTLGVGRRVSGFSAKFCGGATSTNPLVEFRWQGRTLAAVFPYQNYKFLVDTREQPAQPAQVWLKPDLWEKVLQPKMARIALNELGSASGVYVTIDCMGYEEMMGYRNVGL